MVLVLTPVLGIAGGAATGISGDEGRFLSSHFQGSDWANTQ